MKQYKCVQMIFSDRNSWNDIPVQIIRISWDRWKPYICGHKIFSLNKNNKTIWLDYIIIPKNIYFNL